MIRLVFIIIVLVGGLYFLFTKVFQSSDFKDCEKCYGKGYWRAVRGEKEKCDHCRGAGKVLK